MKILILLLGLVTPTNSPTLEDLINDQIWRTNTSNELKRLFDRIELEFDLTYLSDNAIKPKTKIILILKRHETF